VAYTSDDGLSVDRADLLQQYVNITWHTFTGMLGSYELLCHHTTLSGPSLAQVCVWRAHVKSVAVEVPAAPGEHTSYSKIVFVDRY
jgi:hypothetical protein